MRLVNKWWQTQQPSPCTLSQRVVMWALSSGPTCKEA